jgi:methylated-DNA-[protein]-cysteine S-methyltransferase
MSVASDKLARIQFLLHESSLFSAQSRVARQIVVQIKRYFCNPRLLLELPIQVCGTPLQQKIWQSIRRIPCGKTITYGELARKIGTSPRVVGNACRCNPIPVIIPCHRVVAAAGLGGYYGNTVEGLRIKRWLLDHESKKR